MDYKQLAIDLAKRAAMKRYEGTGHGDTLDARIETFRQCTTAQATPVDEAPIPFECPWDSKLTTDETFWPYCCKACADDADRDSRENDCDYLNMPRRFQG